MNGGDAIAWKDIALAGFIFGAIFAMFITPIFTRVLIFIFGRDRSIPPRVIHPFIVWSLSGFISAGLAILGLRFSECLGFAMLISGPIIMGFAFPIALRIAGEGRVKKEFRVKRKYVYDMSRPHKVLKPVFVTKGVTYNELFKWSAYYLLSITLYDNNGPIAKNTYTYPKKWERDYTTLVDKIGCRALDLVIVTQPEPDEIHFVKLSSEWAPILCGDLARISDDERHWWQQFLRPIFPESATATVYLQEFDEHLRAMAAAYTTVINISPGIISDMEGLRHLISNATASIQFMTEDAFDDHFDDYFKGKKDDVVCENGYCIANRK